MTRLTLEVYHRPESLPLDWEVLFETGPDPQSSRAWFAASAAAALPEGAEPLLLGVRKDDRPAVLLPLRAGPGRHCASLTTPYTCLYQPLLAPTADGALVRAAARALGQYARRWPQVILEGLDADWPMWPDFRAGLHRAGLVTGQFAHFGNWHEPVPSGWNAYLATRPGTLRETIRRKSRAAARDPSLRLELAAAPAELGRALAAYEAVYARSWKVPEPFPRFNAAATAALGELGVLRFGVMWAGDRPIAAQYWMVSGGKATLLKLAHDDVYKSVSPGTVLTGHVVRHLLEAEAVVELDFGRGDDDYKQGWVGHRRQRVGLIAFNPTRPQGAALLIRHQAGAFLRASQILIRHRHRSAV